MNKDQFFEFYYTPANNQYIAEGDYRTRSYGWWMQQNGFEFWSLIEKFQEIEPKVIVEVGSAHGGTLLFFDQLVGEDGLTIGLTWPQDTAFTCLRMCPDHQRKGTIKGFECNTHLKTTLTLLKKALGKRKIDCLFLDGDHSYEGCKQDYEMYSPLVRTGGIIGFHDVAIEPGIAKLFDEMPEPKELLPVFYQGIGIMRKE
jgi:cephalosporin hydroxylase